MFLLGKSVHFKPLTCHLHPGVLQGLIFALAFNCTWSCHGQILTETETDSYLLAFSWISNMSRIFVKNILSFNFNIDTVNIILLCRVALQNPQYFGLLFLCITKEEGNENYHRPKLKCNLVAHMTYLDELKIGHLREPGEDWQVPKHVPRVLLHLF